MERAKIEKNLVRVRKEMEDNHSAFSEITDDTVITYAILKVVLRQRSLKQQLRFYEGMDEQYPDYLERI